MLHFVSVCVDAPGRPHEALLLREPLIMRVARHFLSRGKALEFLTFLRCLSLSVRPRKVPYPTVPT